MGCDIHPFIEFSRGDAYWSLSDGPLQLPREYPLWNFIAFGEGGLSDGLPYPPRGLPGELSSSARDHFYAPESALKELLASVEPEREFVAEHLLRGTWPAARDVYEKWQLLPAADFHTHGWLTLSELEETLAWAKWGRERLSPEFGAVVAAMEALARTLGSDRVRLVFAFDG